MKVKFIFNIAGAPGSRLSAPAFDPRSAAKILFPAGLLCLFLLSIAAACPFSLAQEPDAPSSAKVFNPQPDAADSSDPAADQPPETMLPHFQNTRYWLSGQANFIFQTHPPFPAAYSGVHSLSPNYEKATSRVMTLYTGVRLND